MVQRKTLFSSFRGVEGMLPWEFEGEYSKLAMRNM